MSRVLFVLFTLLVSFFVEFLFGRYLSFYGISPQILLLVVVAHGFLRGPVMGESLGFASGLIMDSIGVSMFGIQTLLLTFAGYFSGKLRRRVASERPAAQIVIAIVSTVIYGILAYFLHIFFEPGTDRDLWRYLILGSVLNVFMVPVVFWLTEKWLFIWGLQPEHL